MPVVARVTHGDSSYPVFVADNPWREFTKTLTDPSLLGGPVLPGATVVIVADANTAEIHGPVVEAAFISAGYQALPLVVPAGEACKSWAVAGALHEALVNASVQPGDLVVGLGGGAVTDLAGFVAATYRRGVRFVAAPTTLLGMVDGALGAKSAVNISSRKNVVGAYAAPIAVVADLDALVTLPDERYREGLVELIKNAALLGEESLEWAEDAMGALLDRESAAITEAIVRSADLVSQVDGGALAAAGGRALSFGHELAYAIEERAAAAGETVGHGTALAEGLRFATLVGERHAEADLALGVKVDALLRAAGFEPAPNEDTTLDIGVAMRADQRVAAGDASVLVAPAPGELLAVTLTESELFDAIRDHYGRERYRDYAFEAKMAAREAEQAERELAELEAAAAQTPVLEADTAGAHPAPAHVPGTAPAETEER